MSSNHLDPPLACHSLLYQPDWQEVTYRLMNLLLPSSFFFNLLFLFKRYCHANAYPYWFNLYIKQNIN